jgi:hypothetical protein
VDRTGKIIRAQVSRGAQKEEFWFEVSSVENREELAQLSLCSAIFPGIYRVNHQGQPQAFCRA